MSEQYHSRLVEYRNSRILWQYIVTAKRYHSRILWQNITTTLQEDSSVANSKVEYSNIKTKQYHKQNFMVECCIMHVRNVASHLLKHNTCSPCHACETCGKTLIQTCVEDKIFMPHGFISLATCTTSTFYGFWANLF